ncbi:MAG: hypothetical protein QXF80_07085 [Thermoplasmatales archaeon]
MRKTDVSEYKPGKNNYLAVILVLIIFLLLMFSTSPVYGTSSIHKNYPLDNKLAGNIRPNIIELPSRVSSKLINQTVNSYEGSIFSKKYSMSRTIQSISWETLGPTNIPNSTGISGLNASGKISAFAYDPSDPNTMYIAGGPGPGNSGPYSAAGIFKTTNGGLTWEREDNGLTDLYVCSLWVDPLNSSIILAGTWFNGVYRSINAGDNWNLVYSTSHVTSFAYVNNVLYATSGNGVIASKNYGLTWNLIEATTSPASVIAYGGDSLYVGTDGGSVLKWTNMQGNWTEILNISGFWVWSIAVNELNPLNIFVVEFFSYESPNLFVTNDGGLSWNKTSLPDNGASQYVFLTNYPKQYLLVGDDGNLFISDNLGRSFSTTPLHVDVRLIDELPNGTLIIGSDQGLFESFDEGVSFISLSKSISASLLYDLAVYNKTIATSVQDFSPIVSYDSGYNWNQLFQPFPPIGEGGSVYVNPNNQTLWYAYTWYGLQYSMDGGRSFNFSSGLLKHFEPSFGNYLLSFDPNNSKIVYVGTQEGVYASNDSGISFTKENWPFKNITLIVISPFSNRTIYIGESNGSLFFSNDGGTDWSRSTINGMGGFPISLAIDPNDHSKVLLGSSQNPDENGGVWISYNYGKSFSPDNLGLPSGPSMYPYFSNSIEYDPHTNATAVATPFGIFLSYNSTDWNGINTNLTCKVATGLSWWGGYLYASTYGEGVVRTTAPVPTKEYSIYFNESGLPLGTMWYVNLSTGESFSSALTSLSFNETNGTYSYTVATTDKTYSPSPSSGSFTVNGAPVSENVTFSKVLYNITFNESGLPSGTTWYVNLSNGQSFSSTSSSISFNESNGTYSYTISTPDKTYSPSPSSGSLTVNGASMYKSIAFRPVTYAVTFTESGLPYGSIWYVNLSDGIDSGAITGTSYSFSLPNGTYSYTITTIDKTFSPSPSSGSFTVNGAAVSESVTFMEVVYSVTFTETGLTAGSTWSVTLGTTTQSSNTSTITFTEPNGSYSYSISGISGYRANAYRGTVMINGSSVSISVVWSIITYPIIISETGIPNGTTWTVTLSGIAFNGDQINTTLSSTTNSITFNEPNGTYSFTVHLPSGYTSSSAKGSITVSGTSATAKITIQSQTNYLSYIIVVVIVVVIIAAVITVTRRKK